MKLSPHIGAALVVFTTLASAVECADAKVDEIRAGVVHNVRLDHGDIVDGKEDGENVEFEIVSSSPDFLNLIGSPRPYVVGSLNTGDGVSFAGLGVVWRWEFADGWAFEPGFGYIVHDGEIDNIYAPGTPEAAAFEAQNQLLGSEDLFRTTLALEREFSSQVAAQVYYEHMSHGQVLDSGRNQGLDFVGVRLLSIGSTPMRLNERLPPCAQAFHRPGLDAHAVPSSNKATALLTWAVTSASLRS